MNCGHYVSSQWRWHELSAVAHDAEFLAQQILRRRCTQANDYFRMCHTDLISIMNGRELPSPKTVCVPFFHRSQAVQFLAAARSLSIVGFWGRNGLASPCFLVGRGCRNGICAEMSRDPKGFVFLSQLIWSEIGVDASKRLSAIGNPGKYSAHCIGRIGFCL